MVKVCSVRDLVVRLSHGQVVEALPGDDEWPREPDNPTFDQIQPERVEHYRVSTFGSSGIRRGNANAHLVPRLVRTRRTNPDKSRRK
jgi:hypothetical protein